LLPATQLFGVLALLVVTDFLLLSRQPRLKAVSIGALLILVSATSIILHPTFNHMVRISGNNGYLPLLRIPDLTTLAVLCLVVGVLSALLLYKWLYSLTDTDKRRNGIVVKYVSIYGISNSGLCLLQILMLQFGYGSEYACRKYAFALNTTLLFELALVFGFMFNPLWFKNAPETVGLPAGLFDSTFASLFLLTAILAVLPKNKVADASDLATIERFARTYMQTAFRNSPGTFNYAVAIDHLTPSMNYMITFGALHAPPPTAHSNTEDVSTGKPFSKPELVAHILTSMNSKWDVPQCRTQFSSPSLVVVDGPCVISALSK
jgi:hypothetical protein